jgi:Tfp pilus assembly protein PilF/peroxiredoxin
MRGQGAIKFKNLGIAAGRVVPLFLIITVVGSFFLTVPTAATLQSLQVGMEAPELALKDAQGTPKAFTDLKGEKLTVLVFWSTWTRKSEAALLELQKLHDKYKGQGINIIGIAVDGVVVSRETQQEIQAAIEKNKITFPNYIDHGLAAFHDYGVIAIPSTVILGPDRVIKYELSGFPLMGAQDMADFISSTAEGKEKAVMAEETGYKPDKHAVRMLNMGKNTLKSKRMADTAEMWFKKAIEADPRFTAPHISLGKFYAERNNIAGAKEQFEAALAKEPDNVIAMCELAMILVNEGKLPEGKGLIEKAIKVEESFTPCYYYMGYVLGKEGNLEESMKMFDKALEINPIDYNTHIYKAKVFEERKMMKESAEAYRKALEVVFK